MIRNNVRVVGIDNTHAIKLKSRKRFSGDRAKARTPVFPGPVSTVSYQGRIGSALNAFEETA